ncbi:UDP-N-acetylmuramate dehydrogenase [Flavihumibacter stibioxidans]|uniref:UDP-N-acetylenolpyruvoylglucosamine reductase n=1 Tax=Flavihumibacter stibioxidans TaxID=1834163 RepID=A0ABR7M4A3_9BACT|nr:UDP-N-acetylmuramate dehydrogenase [Flavihumibacter stibioxidans]MBC6489339.1 UDP-N-acetylenolpyruvoylglucosamine reductase [Flavihumibacter stibioxidans]
MNIRDNYSLRTSNSFGVDAIARHFASFEDTESLEDLLSVVQQSPLHEQEKLILGGGSNVLFTRDFNGWVLKNDILGIEELHEDNEFVYVRAGAGENWHAFTSYCIEQGWAGLENLSLIPGNVGAAPMQNIGAYGVELDDVFWDLEAYHLNDKAVHTFTLQDCEFGYRESIFKKKYRNQFVILNVTFRLHKHPVFHTSYGAITQELEKMGVKELSIKAISQAVINIRRSKLPDPAVIGNAGSFFKNPVIPKAQFNELQILYPEMVGYALPDDRVKLAAGWLIESCGWKGFRKGNVGCHEMQALVLVNYGNATGAEVFAFSQEILDSVAFKFGITLEREVNIY